MSVEKERKNVIVTHSTRNLCVYVDRLTISHMLDFCVGILSEITGKVSCLVKIDLIDDFKRYLWVVPLRENINRIVGIKACPLGLGGSSFTFVRSGLEGVRNLDKYNQCRKC